MTIASLLLVLFGLWILAHRKTSRPDGSLIEGLHPYRRLMGFIMPTRNESLVYFDSYVEADALLAYLEEAQRRFPVDVTHCLVAAAFVALGEVPAMNRFASGRRLYQRNESRVTFSMKRKQLDREAKLATVKLRLEPGATFRDLCERIDDRIGIERSGQQTYADREFDLLNALPRPLLRAGVRLLKTLDYFNLLPAGFIENDPLYSSMVIANLGSLGMAPAYHHLYEWGNCPLFMMVGRIEEQPAVVDGRVVARRTLHIRYTYDERIDDGLNARFGIDCVKRSLEHPHETFGCLHADGSDARPLLRPSA